MDEWDWRAAVEEAMRALDGRMEVVAWAWQTDFSRVLRVTYAGGGAPAEARLQEAADGVRGPHGLGVTVKVCGERGAGARG